MRTTLINNVAIKQLREAKGYTQGELAYHAKVDQSLISRLESGELKDARVSTISKLANALGVTIVDLVAEKPLAALSEPELESMIRRLRELAPENRDTLGALLDHLVAKQRRREGPAARIAA